MAELDTLVGLSHEFGAPAYVKGGGGNTSVKDDQTLWVKPSGTTLSGLTAESFVSMSRDKINALYTVETPTEPAAREELVKNFMAEAVVGGTGRPSVEAPLHNAFDQTYVVHTHPVLVNGLTCARDGEAACRRLFSDALWVEYIDPGYTLCMVVRDRIDQYKAAHGAHPGLLVLKNHGLFVAGDSAEEIRALYARMMEPLAAEYARAGIAEELEVAAAPESADTQALIQELFGEDAAFVASSGMFRYLPAGMTPDHMVYARAVPFTDALTTENAAAYQARHGFAPKVVVAGERVYGIGTSQKNADLALEFAQDGAQVMQLTEAFGGVNYMTDAQIEFIENWEVEAYRAKQIG